MSHLDDDDYPDDLGPQYARPEEIPPMALQEALTSLTFFDDPTMRMQAFNLTIIDQFITNLEYQVLQKRFKDERTPFPESAFLLAQSQMWIFAAYELLRTWRQRASDIVKWQDTGGLQPKLQALEKDLGYRHFGREYRADQLREALADPSIVDRAREDLRATAIPFAWMEALRVSLAKHEVRGRKNSIAYAPAYGRINQWCGSLDFEISHDEGFLGELSRRNVADHLRALLPPREVPSQDDIDDFERFISGKAFREATSNGA